MAFTVRNLSVLAYAQGFTLWHYKAAAERVDEACAPDFFEAAGDMIAGGDMLMVSASDGGRVMLADPLWGRLRTVPMG